MPALLGGVNDPADATGDDERRPDARQNDAPEGTWVGAGKARVETRVQCVIALIGSVK